MVFEWLARDELKVMYGENISAGFGSFAQRGLFPLPHACLPYTAFVSGHDARLLHHSHCHCSSTVAQGRKVREFLAAISGLDGDENAVSNIYM